MKHWGVDLEQLRSTCDGISAALSKPMMVSRHWIARSDQERLVDSLRELTTHFSATDLDSKRALTGLLPKRQSTAQTRATCAAVGEVCRAIHSHFSNQIDAAARKQLQHLLDFPAPAYLRAIGSEDSENAHSDVLAHLLSPRRSPGIAPAALERLTHFLPESSKWSGLVHAAIQRDEISVQREVRVGGFWNRTNDLNRMDVIISSPRFVIVIENKLWSREHDHQTDGYWDWLSELPGEKAAILLSPSGFKAQSAQFTAMSYLQIAWCFLGEVPTRLAEEEVMLSGYFKSVFGHVLAPHLRAIMGDHE